ncbi:MAG: STM4013/SEN3800 family hydrolase [Anaerolineae bacterium]|nr:STM4013/SEN3800 family hydrolase [Anaerolineae bacterium]
MELLNPRAVINANYVVGQYDIAFIVLDTLRYDVARDALRAGRTPNLAAVLPGGAWEVRHTPGNFTYAAHHAFFAGFLPTPIAPGHHPRLFAARFPGSGTTTERTYTFDTPDIVTGLAAIGYHTLCIGGVDFFNKQSPLGQVLPGYFAESHWSPEMGINSPTSTEHQVRLAVRRLREIPRGRRVFLFVNVSAIHPPNAFFLPGAKEDSLASHAAALAYVDRQLPPLFAALRQRGPSLLVICSDHGTAYGEDGYSGHRLSHPVVWTVPYAETILPGAIGS